MYSVFRLDCEGNHVLLDTCSDLDQVDALVDYWSDQYPNAYVDYVYKDYYI